MTTDGRDARERTELEEVLGQLVMRSGPPGLRERILGSALEARRNAALTPRLRAVAVACLILIVALLGLDPLIGRHEADRMAALFDDRSPGRPAGEEASELAEILFEKEGEANCLARLQVMAASAVWEAQDDKFIKARERLKGWFENETSEDPL